MSSRCICASFAVLCAFARTHRKHFHAKAQRTAKDLKSEWARHTWECVAPIHIRGYCPHTSNHLRRRIHQPSLLPRTIHRNACAVQVGFSFSSEALIFLRKEASWP